MQAITTKYLPPTQTKPGRVKATAEAGSVIVSWQDEIDIAPNHMLAALALSEKFGWIGPQYGRLIQGELPGGGFVHVSDGPGALTSEDMQGEKIEFKKVRHDVNGNPRYVCHFFALDVIGRNEGASVSDRYADACKLARKIGGRKFHNKQFGGGIVFQSYSLAETVADIERVTGKKFSGFVYC